MPRHVFWVRRGLALGLAVGVVWALVGLVGLLDLSVDGGGSARATTTGAEPSTTPTDEADDELTRKERRAARLARQAAQAADPDADEKDAGKPMPTGPCADSDVVVTPSVPDGHAGGPVTVLLEVSTLEAEACTWQVDPDSVFVTITDGTTTLWSSQHCPRAIPTERIVPRQDAPDRVRLTWSGKESQPGCTVATDWVWPGTYTVNAVARGSVNAVEASFALGDPEALPQAETRQPRESADSGRAERRAELREQRREERREAEAQDQAEREEARREALRQAREAQREERREQDSGEQG